MNISEAIRKLWWVGAAVALAAGPAFADSKAYNMVDGFKIFETDSRPPWLAMVFSLVFLGAVCAAAFKNAKRTHLD